MTDIFESKNISPMLIGEMREAFDGEDYIFELKLDGERCLAYLDPVQGTELRNKRNMRMNTKVPELSEIHKQVKRRCILDGELVVIKDGKPDFFEIQRRSLTENEFKIHLQSKRFPAVFTAFDIIYNNNSDISSLPLIERKAILDETVIENDRLAVSRYIEKRGIEFYKISEENDLEGIVAKRKDSKYYYGKRTKDWIKIKNLKDEDFVICGYIIKENNIISIVLGQYYNDILVYRGHVTLGISSGDYRIISGAEKLSKSPFISCPSGNENAVWIKPVYVCTVKYMMKTESGTMRQPVFKGIRNDKEPKECIVV